MINLIAIIVLQIIYMPLKSLRKICMAKNLKILTCCFGFMESLVYIFCLAIIFTGEKNFVEMIVYAFGFSCGLFIGTYLEGKIVSGFESFEVNINKLNTQLLDYLREKGFGVTVFEGTGKSGKRIKFEVLARRERKKEFIDIVDSFEPGAYIVSYEAKLIKGGYLGKIIVKRMNLKTNKKLSDEISQEKIVKSKKDRFKSEINTLLKIWINDNKDR